MKAVRELVFAYLKDKIYEVKLRLYQVEKKLNSKKIMRASKSVLLNIDHIISIRPALNGRLYAKMKGGEDILVSRKYAQQIVNHFMGKET